jgi:hypothetical protein
MDDWRVWVVVIVAIALALAPLAVQRKANEHTRELVYRQCVLAMETRFVARQLGYGQRGNLPLYNCAPILDGDEPARMSKGEEEETFVQGTESLSK